MLRELDCKSYRETVESQIAAGRHNPASVIKPTINGRKRRHVLPVGDSDDWSAFYRTENDMVYVISINRSLGYCGAQGYGPEDQEPDESLSVFCQTDDEVENALGRKGLDLTDRTIARRLIALLEEIAA